MISWMVPMISSSVIGRPSMVARMTPSTTSPRSGWRRRVSMKSLIEADSPSQHAPASGSCGSEALAAMYATRSMSPGGAAMTISKKARLGYGRAKSSMNSHPPASMKLSISPLTSSRVRCS